MNVCSGGGESLYYLVNGRESSPSWPSGCCVDEEEKTELGLVARHDRTVGRQSEGLPEMSAGTELHPWEWPDQPCVCLHADYAGPIGGKMVFVLVDAHSKWLKAFVVGSATSSMTIEKLRSTFARFGLPELLITNNGSVFTSSKSNCLLRRTESDICGVHHITQLLIAWLRERS